MQNIRIVKFGNYKIRDDNDYSSIEWIVLDEKDGKTLLLTKYVIEAMPYHEKYEESTWERCTLRRWLNRSFFDFAFSESEKRQICDVSVETPDFGKLTKPILEKDQHYSWIQHRRDIPASLESLNTIDKIFLLSTDEAEKYKSIIETLEVEPTSYAKNKGLLVIKDKQFTPGGYLIETGKVYCQKWWLRNRGNEADLACYADDRCRISKSGFPMFFADTVLHGVRPAIWVDGILYS